MKKALIVYGGWPGHEPEKCTEIIKGMLEPEGYEVRAEYQTSAFAQDYVHEMDLLIPIVTMAFHFDPRGEIKKLLLIMLLKLFTMVVVLQVIMVECVMHSDNQLIGSS